MQPARNPDNDYLAWVWTMYDGILNRGDPAPFLAATRDCRQASFNGKRLSTGAHVADAYASLRAALPSRRFKLERTSFDFDVVIAPETFAHCASVWWIVDSSQDAASLGNPIFGATQILFHDDQTIIELRDLWAPVP